MTAELLAPDAFFAAAQDGRTKEAAQAADRRLRGHGVDERTRAYAALTYLHAGRFRSAKRVAKGLSDATGHEAAWARAAVAVAFHPGRSADAVTRLAPFGQGTNEFALLAGVSAMQHGDDDTGQRLLATATIHPSSVFATAGALGMRHRANMGAGGRIFLVGCGLLGLLLFSIVGALLGIAAGRAINRRSLRRRTTGGAYALLDLDTPRERHSLRELAVGTIVLIGILVAIGVGIWALVELLG